ncbi:MAG: hypothetical protein A2Y62_13660 [Candidatus Fischerbacteria bacterium RBG_13_37_8]|uniref:DUF4340 domain-containing protein n=1 Tax=Candidatus Fischerbacteria bacterium RBG_13_37_8 TaxID=1817863 RepID=A0A1F5V7G3_9BACT|nr:MAG: hypothetical protein A2Y62_13660 [Candidatus Fischerbacteria bacterium RBG_13_37_8]
MKLKGLLILLLIFAALAAFFYYYEIKGDKIREGKKEAEKKLYSFTINNVTKIELINTKNHITFIKENNIWKITSPVSELAEQDIINALLEKIGSISIDKDITISSDRLNEFGLKPGNAIYKLYKGTQAIAQLVLGNINPSSEKVYAYELMQKKSYLLSKQVQTDLEFDLFKVRDKRMTEFKSEEVTGFEIIAGERRIASEYENNLWHLTYPKNVLADNIKISSFLAAMEFLKAERFEDNTLAPARFSLDKSTYVVTIYISNKNKITKIDFSVKADNELYAIVEGNPNIVKIPTNILEYLIKSWTYWRENKPIIINSFDAKKIIINNSGNIIELSKNENDAWYITKPAIAQADAKKVNSFLWSFEQFNNSDVLETQKKLSEYAFDTSNLSLTIIEETAGKEIEKTIIIGKHDTANRKVYVLNKQNNTIFVVQEQIMTVLNKQSNDFALDKNVENKSNK